MKLIILNAIKEWVLHKAAMGAELWPTIASEAGFGADRFITQDNYADRERIERLIQCLLSALNLGRDAFRTSFFEFWMTSFAPRVYQLLARQANSARECLIQIIRLQNELCNFFPSNTYVSKVDLNDINENALTVIYASEKTLIDIIAVLRGVSGIYQETFTVRKINPHSSEIRFEKH